MPAFCRAYGLRVCSAVPLPFDALPAPLQDVDVAAFLAKHAVHRPAATARAAHAARRQRGDRPRRGAAREERNRQSSLAAALVERGFPLIADDVTGIAVADGRKTALPASASLPLWADTLEQMRWQGRGRREAMAWFGYPRPCP